MIKYLRVECNDYHDQFEVKEVSLEEIASMHSMELEGLGWLSPRIKITLDSAEVDGLGIAYPGQITQLTTKNISKVAEHGYTVCQIVKPESILTGELLEAYRNEVKRKERIEKAKLKKKQDAAQKKKERELAKAKKLLQEEGLIT